MALDIPPERFDGNSIIAADYNKVRTSLTAVAPRILQPAVRAVEGAGTLDSRVGYHAAAAVGGDGLDGDAIFGFLMPSDFVTLTKAVVRCLATVSGNLVYAIGAAFAAVGETDDSDVSALIPGAPLPMTLDRIAEINIASLFTGHVAAGDSVGIIFSRQGSALGDTLLDFFILSLDIEYTP